MSTTPLYRTLMIAHGMAVDRARSARKVHPEVRLDAVADLIWSAAELLYPLLSEEEKRRRLNADRHASERNVPTGPARAR